MAKRRLISDHWQDKAFVAEMNDRYNEYKSGKVKLVTLDEAEHNARAACKLLANRIAEESKFVQQNSMKAVTGFE